MKKKYGRNFFRLTLEVFLFVCLFALFLLAYFSPVGTITYFWAVSFCFWGLQILSTFDYSPVPLSLGPGKIATYLLLVLFLTQVCKVNRLQNPEILCSGFAM